MHCGQRFDRLSRRLKCCAVNFRAASLRTGNMWEKLCDKVIAIMLMAKVPRVLIYLQRLWSAESHVYCYFPWVLGCCSQCGQVTAIAFNITNELTIPFSTALVLALTSSQRPEGNRWWVMCAEIWDAQDDKHVAREPTPLCNPFALYILD